MDPALGETPKKTARMLLRTVRGGTGFETWTKLDRRAVASHTLRELCAVPSLMVPNRRNEVRAHIHATLDVGATREEAAAQVFEERGEWEA